MKESNSRILAEACAAAAEDAKAADIEIYDLSDCSDLTNFVVVCTASSVPHLRSVLRKIDEQTEEKLNIRPVYAERTPQALWAVLDYIDVMVHVMTAEMRAFYNLEDLWKHGTIDD